MKTVLYAPDRMYDECHPFKVFLAGSIDMGAAENWQVRVVEELRDYPVTVLNPRRSDWNSEWRQEIDNPQFHEQVTWELDHLEMADIVFFHFDPSGKSPVTLMELGLMVNSQCPILVSSPPGFWRRGNVQVLCDRYAIPLFDTLEAAIASLRQILPSHVIELKEASS